MSTNRSLMELLIIHDTLNRISFFADKKGLDNLSQASKEMLNKTRNTDGYAEKHSKIKVTNIPKNQLDDLLDFFKAATKLTSIHLEKCEINIVNMKQLISIFQNNTSLDELSLIDCQLNKETMTLLSDFLKTNNSIKNLDLTKNNLGPAGGKIIAELLKTNTTLESLNLADNKLCSMDIRNTRDMVAKVTAKENIALIPGGLFAIPFNKIISANISPIANAIKVNSTLKKINLDENNLNIDDAGTIFQALKSNPQTCLEVISYSDGDKFYRKDYEAIMVSNTHDKFYRSIVDFLTTNKNPDGSLALSSL